jgi:hypothetical protein
VAETNLAKRMLALADVAWAQEWVRLRGKQEDGSAVAQQAAVLQAALEEINGRLFRKVRADLLAGRHDKNSLRQLLDQFTDYRTAEAPSRYMGGDALDVLLNNVLQLDVLTAATQPRTADMVHLEFTPVRAILEMIDQVSFGADDVFYDMGSGLGQVALLVAWLTDSQSRGVEIDPGYCCQAQRLAAEFGVTDVQFIQADARAADYSDGTIFFMFTPFIGQMLQGVLARLQAEAAKRPITLCTYGTVTSDVAELPWLRCRERARLHAFKLCVFENGR